MQAVWYEKVGAAREVLVFGARPMPRPGRGEVLIQLETSGVNPSDVKARAGVRGGKSSLAYPFVIPHSDGAGQVVACGDGCTRFAPGSRVWVCNAQWQRSHGTAAEYVALPEDLVFALPDAATYEVGAALGIPALAACHLTMGFGELRELPVLVSGGAGTVGRLAVQIAKQAGAFVVASGHGNADRSRILSAGADAFVDFTSSSLANDVLDATGGRPIAHGVEVEFGANIDQLADVMAERGTIATYGSARLQLPHLPFYKLLFKGISVHFVLVYLLTPHERNAAAAAVNRLVQAGRLDVPVHRTLALDDTATAHEIVEDGGRQGAVVVRVRSAS